MLTHLFLYTRHLLAKPQPTTSNLAEMLIEMSRSQVTYVSKDSLDFARVRKDIEALMPIKPSDGWALKGMLYALAGEEQTMRESFKNSIKICAGFEPHVNFAGCLAILGYFSEAQKQLFPFLLSESGFLAFNIDRGAQYGMFCLLADQIMKAKERGMSLSIEKHQVEKISTAARILSREGITDEQVAEQLDLVGEVLRRHSMIAPPILYKAVDIPDIFVGVVVEANVPVDADTVVSMNIELAELSIKRGAPVHERLAVLFSQRVQ